MLSFPMRQWVDGALVATGHTLNATNETAFCIGQVQLEGGVAGGSKVISNVGGKIHWHTGASVTFANAGTNLRVGIQDVSTTLNSAGDGTFDVYADLVGGTDPLAANTGYEVAMTTGSKTIDQGDFLALTIGMTARGGVDSVSTKAHSDTEGDTSPYPGNSFSTGGNGTFITGSPFIVIEFDDGTFGWLGGTLAGAASSSVAFNVNTGTADEYGNLFVAPFGSTLVGMDIALSAAFTADFEVVLYSSPLSGTPVVMEAISVDATNFITAGRLQFYFSTAHELTSGETYAISIRPITTNAITNYYTDVANSSHWLSSASSDVYAVRRLDNTGAFSDWNGGTAKTRRMHMTMLLDDPSGGAVGGVGAFTSNNDAAFAWLRGQGYTGTYNDMLKQFLSS